MRRTTKDILENRVVAKKRVKPLVVVAKKQVKPLVVVGNYSPLAALDIKIILVSKIRWKGEVTESNEKLLSSLQKIGGFTTPLIVVKRGIFEYDLADSAVKFAALLEAKKIEPQRFETIRAYVCESVLEADLLQEQLGLY